MPARRNKGGLLARVNFPLYTVQMLTSRHILVGGGGGSSKTGVANGFVSLIDLCKLLLFFCEKYCLSFLFRTCYYCINFLVSNIVKILWCNIRWCASDCVAGNL